MLRFWITYCALCNKNPMEFYPCSQKQIECGNFPLNHDCILKVDYIAGSPIRFAYFTCRCQDSGLLADVVLKLSVVKRVNIVSVDEFNMQFL